MYVLHRWRASPNIMCTPGTEGKRKHPAFCDPRVREVKVPKKTPDLHRCSHSGPNMRNQIYDMPNQASHAHNNIIREANVLHARPTEFHLSPQGMQKPTCRFNTAKES